MTKKPIDGTTRIDYGTKERRGKSKMRPTVRDVSNSGNVVTTGLTDTEHCFLDKLLNEEYISDAEYSTAYRLREMYYTINPSEGVSSLEEKGSGSNPYTMDAEIGDTADLLETRYNRIMARIQDEYRQLIRAICIEDGVETLAGTKNVNSFKFAIYLLEKAFLEDLKYNQITS